MKKLFKYILLFALMLFILSGCYLLFSYAGVFEGTPLAFLGTNVAKIGQETVAKVISQTPAKATNLVNLIKQKWQDYSKRKEYQSFCRKIETLIHTYYRAMKENDRAALEAVLAKTAQKNENLGWELKKYDGPVRFSGASISPNNENIARARYYFGSAELEALLINENNQWKLLGVNFINDGYSFEK